MKDKLLVGRPGACASKLSSRLIDDVIRSSMSHTLGDRVLVGPETRDDAAAYALNESQALVLSLDYSTPFCSDPSLFGAIAAANALSDIFAMGGRPITALSILGAPSSCPEPVLLAITKAAADICSAIGVPILGGHSAEADELLFGLSLAGLCSPSSLVRNSTARAGDSIILTKPLGFGVYAKVHAHDPDHSEAEAAWLLGRQLNAVGASLSDAGLLNAMTDVTGFGLLGHLYEMARGSVLRASIEAAAVPILPLCQTYLEAGGVTGAGLRNRSSVSSVTSFARHLPRWLQALLTEPETNGGLLLSVHPGHVGSVISMLREHKFGEAVVIGRFDIGPDGIDVR